jgi:hypothetical protein
MTRSLGWAKGPGSTPDPPRGARRRTIAP